MTEATYWYREAEERFENSKTLSPFLNLLFDFPCNTQVGDKYYVFLATAKHELIKSWLKPYLKVIQTQQDAIGWYINHRWVVEARNTLEQASKTVRKHGSGRTVDYSLCQEAYSLLVKAGVGMQSSDRIATEGYSIPPTAWCSVRNVSWRSMCYYDNRVTHRIPVLFRRLPNFFQSEDAIEKQYTLGEYLYLSLAWLWLINEVIHLQNLLIAIEECFF